MAAGWVKSFQCKSKAFEDVYHPHPTNTKQLLLLPTSSCSNTYQNLKDVVGNPKSKPKSKPPRPHPDSYSQRPHRRSDSAKSNPTSSPSNARVRRTLSAPIKPQPLDPFLPSLSELPSGHPSRNVVEIIFHTRWGPKGFSGRVEMVFKIQSLPRTLTRFEEYREKVIKVGAGSGRCSADGNEMMRFSCMGPTMRSSSGGIIDVRECTVGSEKGSICTYSGSGVAHESVGWGKGRRAMMVCRVIAGRVRVDSVEDGSEFDSVSRGKGELLVFDSRAVLPCFLVIYKL